MQAQIFRGIMIPFLGTALGSLAAEFVVPFLAYLLSFAAGFTVMMTLDVALG